MPAPRQTTALYLRVSSSEQSFASQEHTLREYCRRQGWKNLRDYREKISGLKSTLPVLARLMEDVRSGQIDRIVVFKLDRIGRSPIHVWQLLEELKKRKIGLIAVTENFDTSEANPMAHAMHQIGAVWAGLFSAQLSERVRAGQAAARKRGSKGPGRPGISPETVQAITDLLKNQVRAAEIAHRCKVSLPIVYKIKNAMKEEK
jgi:DNA invertase Pin-like site-specific DNA recombinase